MKKEGKNIAKAHAAVEKRAYVLQDAVPLLQSTSIFRPTAAENAIIAGLLSPTAPAAVGCLNLPNGTVLTLPSSTCAFALDSIFTVNPTFNPLNPFLSQGQAALNAFLINQFETQGGLFPYNTREYLASGRLDHRFNVNNEISVTYRY